MNPITALIKKVSASKTEASVELTADEQKQLADIEAAVSENATLKAQLGTLSAKVETLTTSLEAASNELKAVNEAKAKAEADAREEKYEQFCSANLERIGPSHKAYFKSLFAHMESMPDIEGKSAIETLQGWMTSKPVAQQPPANVAARTSEDGKTVAKSAGNAIDQLPADVAASLDPAKMAVYNEGARLAAEKNLSLSEGIALAIANLK